MTETSYCVSKEAQRYLFHASVQCWEPLWEILYGGGFWWCRVCYPVGWVWGFSGQEFVQAARGGVAPRFSEYVSISVILSLGGPRFAGAGQCRCNCWFLGDLYATEEKGVEFPAVSKAHTTHEFV